MRHTSTRPAIAFATVIAVLVAACSASAAGIRINERHFTAEWERLTFTGSGIDITCPVTIGGSFHSGSFTVRSAVQIGVVLSAQVIDAECEEGGGLILARVLPWRILYESLEGSLPYFRSVGLQFVGSGIELDVLGLACLYASTERAPIKADAFMGEESSDVTSIAFDAAATIPKSSGSETCPASVTLRGASEVPVLAVEELTATVLEFIDAAAAPGQIRVEPTAVSIPAGRTEERTITISNRAGIGGLKIDIDQESLIWRPIHPNHPGSPIRITPGETCESAKLAINDANPCTIRVRFVGPAAPRP
jgi:hypothetical protein